MADNVLKIIGEFVDNISPAFGQLGQNAGVLQATLAGLAGGLAAGAAVAIFEKLGEVIGDVITAIPELTAQAIEAADEMDDLAQKTGIAVDELQALKLAASMEDVSDRDLASSIRKLNAELAKADGDSTSKAALTFKALGINIKDANGQVISASTAMAGMANSFKGMADGANKSNIAMEMGGRGLVNMIPLLNKGSEELQKWKDIQKGMGFAFTQEDMDLADAFGKAVKLVKETFAALGVVIAKELLPGLTTTAEYFAEGAKEGGTLNAIVKALGETFAFLAKFISPVIYVLAILTAGIKQTAQALAGLAAAATFAFQWDFAGAKAALKAMDEDIRKTYDDLERFLDKSQNPEKYQLEGPPKPTDQGPNPEALVKAQKMADEYAKALSELNKELTKATQSGKENEVTFDTLQGKYKNFTQTQKDTLIGIARQIDIQAALTKVTLEYNAALDARNKKEDQVNTAANAAYMSDRTRRAGYLEAERQRAEFEEKAAKMREENNKLAAGARSVANANLDKALEDYRPGGAQYEAAIATGEAIDKVNSASKVWTDTINKNADALKDLNIQQKQYDLMLSQGAITLEQHAKLMQDNRRAVEDLAAAQTIAGKAYQEVIVNNRRAMDDVVMKMAAIRDANDAGKITTAEYTKAMYDLQTSYDNLNPTYAVNQVQKLKDEIKSASGAFEGMFSDYIFNAMQGKWKNLGDMIKQIIDKMVANMIAAQLQMALFGDMGSTPAGKTPSSTGLIGSLFGAVFGGMRESGGPVEAGKAYIVGEKRPEVFIPQTSGKIVPDAGSMAPSIGTYINSLQAVDMQSFESLVSRSSRHVGQTALSAQQMWKLKGS